MTQQTILSRLRWAQDVYKKYDIRTSYLTGSYASSESTETSDVDIYIPDVHFSDLYVYMNCKFDLEKVVWKPVDLITDDNLKAAIKPYILKNSILI